MRRIYLMVVISFLTVTLIGQHADIRNRFNSNPFIQKKNKSFAQQQKIRAEHTGKKGSHFFENLRNEQNSSRDIKQALSSIISESFEGEQWNNEDNSQFMYDLNGFNTLQTNQLWAGEWVDYDKSEQSYDPNGNLLVSTYYDWDDDNNTWVPSNEDSYTYNENGQLAVYIVAVWDANAWEEYIKSEFEYDGNGKLTEEIIYGWNAIEEEWIESWKGTYGYDGNGNMVLETSYSWNVEWMPLWKTDLTYDADKNVILEVNSSWKEANNDWEFSWKDEYTYDENGNMVALVDYEWEGDWNLSWKSEISYNNSYSIDELIMPWWWFEDDYITYRHMPITGTGYDYNAGSNDWDMSTRSTLSYAELDVTGINNPEGSSIKVYPNPATDYISFDLENGANETTVELYDLQGRLVLRQTVSAKTKIKVGHLNRGQYVYKIQHNDKSFGDKVIIE